MGLAFSALTLPSPRGRGFSFETETRLRWLVLCRINDRAI
jgi:hypothetical protein